LIKNKSKISFQKFIANPKREIEKKVIGLKYLKVLLKQSK